MGAGRRRQELRLLGQEVLMESTRYLETGSDRLADIWQSVP